MLFCFFEYRYICVLHSTFFEIFVSDSVYFIHRILVIVQSVIKVKENQHETKRSLLVKKQKDFFRLKLY